VRKCTRARDCEQSRTIIDGTLTSDIVKVGSDEAGHRYFVFDSNIPGLHVEASSFEAFVEATQDIVLDLVGARPEGCRVRFEREVALAG
jgi:hypothetical protein